MTAQKKREEKKHSNTKESCKSGNLFFKQSLRTDSFLFGEFLSHIPCWLPFMWGVFLTHPVLASLCGEFLLHVLC